MADGMCLTAQSKKEVFNGILVVTEMTISKCTDDTTPAEPQIFNWGIFGRSISWVCISSLFSYQSPYSGV